MNPAHSNWTVFTALCRLVGGEDDTALIIAQEPGILSNLVEMAQIMDLLPAVATRIQQQPELESMLDTAQHGQLNHALRDNTRKNMQAVSQAIKLARSLNRHGILPTFLKGTAQLLTTNQSRLGFRKQIDIDLVVAPEELKPACLALLDAGYAFADESCGQGNQQNLYHDIDKALELSSHHHHLPPLVMLGSGMSVELHRHYLPRRFQQGYPLQELIDSAREHQSHNARFRVPGAEHHIAHIILGKFIHDGYCARHDFPIREACDYIDLVKSAGAKASGNFLVDAHRKAYAIFSQLVVELMGYRALTGGSGEQDITARLWIMKKRYCSTKIARFLDARARSLHLARSMVSSPEKLPGYLRRNFHIRSKPQN